MAKRCLARLAQRPRTVTPLRVAVALFLCAWWGTALLSGYRAIYQIRSVELTVGERILRPGTRVQARIATSGRTYARLTLELVQGAHAETLAVRRVPGNRDGATDPRSRRASIVVSLTPELLARYEPGPARLRASGLGSSQWLRVPPPTVREVVVALPAGPPAGGGRERPAASRPIPP